MPKFDLSGYLPGGYMEQFGSAEAPSGDTPDPGNRELDLSKLADPPLLTPVADGPWESPQTVWLKGPHVALCVDGPLDGQRMMAEGAVFQVVLVPELQRFEPSKPLDRDPKYKTFSYRFLILGEYHFWVPSGWDEDTTVKHLVGKAYGTY